MSELFDAGLRDLYAAAERAHDARPGLAVDLMVARTRRRRRARAAAVTMATAAAVVGVAVAGAAVVQTLDEPPAPPVDRPTSAPITGTETELTCGTAVEDLRRVPQDWGVVLHLGLDDATPTASTLSGWLGTGTEEVRAAWQPVSGSGIPDGYRFAVVRDGVVVGTAQANLMEVPARDGTRRTHDARISPVACDGGTLPPGPYELVASLPLRLETEPDTWVTTVLVSEPVAFTAPEVGPLPAPEAHDTSDNHSTLPPTDPAAPLRDGSYIGIVSGVDPVAGTVTADVVVLYFGQGALDWVAANDPGAEVFDDYVMDDPDGPSPRTLPLGDAEVWEWSPSEAGLTIARRLGGVAEWAAAPTDDRERRLADGAAMPRGGLYWLDVRDGVVAQVVGQYVP